VAGALANGRRATLEAIRDRLAAILDGTEGHERHCECECGTPWDAGKSAGIARELRAVIAELDDLPEEGGGSEVDRIQAEREARRQQARESDEGQGE
jgi:hypothetical protein